MTSTTPANDSGLHPDGSRFPVAKTETQWREMLGAQAYHVLREAGIRPFEMIGQRLFTGRVAVAQAALSCECLASRREGRRNCDASC